MAFAGRYPPRSANSAALLPFGLAAPSASLGRRGGSACSRTGSRPPAFGSRERNYGHRRTSLGELGSDLRHFLRPGISNLPMRKHRRASGLNTSNEVDEAPRNREVLPL
jgi:hypothetical protein